MNAQQSCRSPVSVWLSACLSNIPTKSLKWIIIWRNFSSQNSTDSFCFLTPPHEALLKFECSVVKVLYWNPQKLGHAVKSLSLRVSWRACSIILIWMSQARHGREVCGFKLFLWHCGSSQRGAACMRSFLWESLGKILFCAVCHESLCCAVWMSQCEEYQCDNNTKLTISIAACKE